MSIHASLLGKTTEEAIELWLTAYKKNPQLTVVATIIGATALFGFLITINILGEREREAIRQKNATYAEQLHMLNETETNLKNLTEFVESEKRKLAESEKLLNELKEEQKLLKPLVETDRQAIESLFQLQNQRNQANLSTERWIGFGLGVLSSIIASVILTAIRYFYSKRKKVKSDETVADS